MVSISKSQVITMNRGDSLLYPIFINAGTKLLPIRYTLGAGDTLYVGISEPNQKWEDALIKKVYTEADLNQYGDVDLKLVPEDTEHVLPGLYYYEAKLVHESEEGTIVTTIIPKKKLYIVE